MMKRALIAGGSLGGLSAGLFLLRTGWDVHIYEKTAEEMDDRGGGIVTQEAMWEALAGAGLVERPGVRLERRVVYARDGSVTGELRRDETVSSWDSLYRMLLGALPPERYHLDHTVEGFAQTAEVVTLHFAGGGTAHGELLVAADGIGSAIRKQLLPEVTPRYANYVAWRGLVPEADMPAQARDALADAFSFCTAPHEQIVSYTVPGAKGEPDRRRQNSVWYRPADEAHELQDLLTDAKGETHHPNIPAPKIRPAVIAELRAHAEAVLSPAFAAFVQATEHPALQPVSDYLAPQIAFGRVALIGDAAAQARPHSGAGTTKAIGDAAALAAALANSDASVADALRAYEAERLPVAREMVEHGRWLGRHLDPANGPGGNAPGEDQATDTLLNVSARAKVGEDERVGEAAAESGEA